MAQSILKYYEYGNAKYVDQYDHDVYVIAMLATGDKLQNFWQLNVKKYFNRSKPSYFTKSGQFKLVRPKPGPKRSVMVDALGPPSIKQNSGIGLLPLYNVVKRNTTGEQIELIKLLMTGAGGKSGMHYSPGAGGMTSGGSWKGFPASYWRMWDSVFTKQCLAETNNLGYYLEAIKDQDTFRTGDASYESREQVITAVERNKISNMRLILK